MGVAEEVQLPGAGLPRRERVEQRRWQEHRTRDRVVPVRPHPAMDESYFLEPVG